MCQFWDLVDNKPENYCNSPANLQLSDKIDHFLSALLEDTSPDASGSKGSPLSSRPELVSSSKWDFDSRVVFECNDKYSRPVLPKKQLALAAGRDYVKFLEDFLCHKKIP